MSKRELTPEQTKSKRQDEIACRVACGLFLVFIVIQLITR